MNPETASLLEALSSLINNNNSNQHQPLQHEPQVPLPEKFDENRKNFRGFLNQIELVFMINLFATPRQQSRLELLVPY